MNEHIPEMTAADRLSIHHLLMQTEMETRTADTVPLRIQMLLEQRDAALADASAALARMDEARNERNSYRRDLRCTTMIALILAMALFWIGWTR